MALAAAGSWSTISLLLLSKIWAPSAKQSDMNWGMVPDWVGFQFGRYGVSESLSFLSLRHWSTSSSQLLAGSLKPACFGMGWVLFRMNVIVQYGSVVQVVS